MQLDLFDTQAVENLREEVAKLSKSNAAVRRGLFARNTALEKYMGELQSQNEMLERELYRLKQTVYEMQKKLATVDVDCQIHEISKVRYAS